MNEFTQLINPDTGLGALITAILSGIIRFIDLTRIAKGKKPLFTFRRV